MGFSSLIAIVPLLFWIGVIALIVKLVKGNSGKELTDKERDDILKSIYTYLVLFVTLMMTIGGSVALFMGAADYVAPSYYVEPYDTFRGNRVQNDIFNNGNIGYSDELYKNLTELLVDENFEETIREDYNAVVESRKEDARRGAVRKMIQSLGWIVIPLPVFIVFQKQKQNETL